MICRDEDTEITVRKRVEPMFNESWKIEVVSPEGEKTYKLFHMKEKEGHSPFYPSYLAEQLDKHWRDVLETILEADRQEKKQDEPVKAWWEK